MVRDAVRGYWALASGLTDVTRQKALAAARALVSQGEATAEQVSAIAEDLLSTSLSNRTALVNVVRFEVDRARSMMGVVTTAELTALSRRVDDLESELAAVRSAPAGAGATRGRPAKKATAKKAAKASRPGAPTRKATPAPKKATGKAPSQTAGKATLAPKKAPNKTTSQTARKAAASATGRSGAGTAGSGSSS